MKHLLKQKMHWLLKVSFIFMAFFQIADMSTLASPTIFDQGHHIGISETYVYDEIESSAYVEVGLTDGLSRVLSVKGVRPNHEVLAGASSVAARGSSKYLYHYTSREAAQSISQSGLRVGKDGFSYLTNNSALKPLQAQIELALPANRALPNSLLRINTSGLTPAAIRRVQGNLPGLGAGGGTEFLFNQTIPASAIKIIR